MRLPAAGAGALCAQGGARAGFGAGAGGAGRRQTAADPGGRRLRPLGRFAEPVRIGAEIAGARVLHADGAGGIPRFRRAVPGHDRHARHRRRRQGIPPRGRGDRLRHALFRPRGGQPRKIPRREDHHPVRHRRRRNRQERARGPFGDGGRERDAEIAPAPVGTGRAQGVAERGFRL